MEEKQSLYLFGIHPVTEAILAGRKFDKILVRKGAAGPQFTELLKLAEERALPVQFVPAEKMNYLVRGAHQGVIAYISQIDYVPFEEMVEGALSRKAAPLFLVLDGVTDVRNLGAIARSAECAGVDGIVLPAKGGADRKSTRLNSSH